MSKRGVSKVMREADRFREGPIAAETVRQRTCDLRHLNHVIEARPKTSCVRHSDETLHLRFVLEVAERLRVNNAIAIDLV
jgi:hypothetical protein